MRVEQAIEFQNEGWAVFPVGRDKKPLLPAGEQKKYLYQAATEDEIIGFWKRFPDANVGLGCGKVSGRTVVDIDDGEDVFPDTRTVQTPSRGFHKIYLYSPVVGNSVGSYYAGIDVRNDGGYIVAAGSHCEYEKKGKKISGDYTVVDEIPERPFPTDLFQNKSNKNPPVTIAGVVEGGRNDSLFAFIREKIKLLPASEWHHVYEMALKKNEGNVPALSVHEVQATFESAANFAKEKGDDIQRNVRMVRDMLVQRIHDDYHITLARGDAKIFLKFLDPIFGVHSFDCELDIKVEKEKEGVVVERHRSLNLEASSTMTDFRRALEKSSKEAGIDVDWASILEKAANLIREDLISVTAPDFCEGENVVDSQFLFEPFLEENSNNLIFGDGGTGKSYFCLALALHAAEGRSFLGHNPSKAGLKTLWVDYEGGGKNKFVRRRRNVVIGSGLDPAIADSHVAFYLPQGDVFEIRTLLKKYVIDMGFSLVIIDAGVSASGGDPNDVTKVQKLFTALGRLPCTKLVIHHEPKAVPTDAKKSYYGSTYWNNYPRAVHRLTTDVEYDKWTKVIRVKHTKTNESYEHDDFLYTMKNSKPGEKAFTSFELLQGVESITARRAILVELKTAKDAQPKAMSIAQLGGLMMFSEDHIKKTAIQMKKEGLTDTEGTARTTKWKLTELGELKAMEYDDF